MIKLLFYIATAFIAIVSCHQKQKSTRFLLKAIDKDSVQLFAPGYISTGLDERDAAFSVDGNLFLFSVKTPGGYAIAIVRKVLGWGEPEIASFSGEYTDIEPAFHPNADLFYFVSDRPLPGATETSGVTNIWYMDYKDGVFGTPTPVPGDVNGKGNVYYPSLTNDTTLYFTRRQTDGSEAIWRSGWETNQFGKSEILPKAINSTNSQFNAFIDPSERFIIVPTYGRDDAIGGSDYYFSFRNSHGKWSNLVQPGKPLNSEKFEYTPYITPDGEYFIFQSNRSTLFDGELNYEFIQQMHRLPGNGGSDLYITGTGFFEYLENIATWE